MSRDIYEHANDHFFTAGVGYEYGRPDMQRANSFGNHTTDSSRTEQDNDHDGLRGVDCSSFVWRGLKDAGYDVGNEPFATSLINKLTPSSQNKKPPEPPCQCSQASSPSVFRLGRDGRQFGDLCPGRTPSSSPS